MTKVLRGDRCQCTVCREYFNSTYAFDKHRKGPYTNRRCLTVNQMYNAGMAINRAGFWISGTTERNFRKGAEIAPDGHTELN
jgi:uncharacterized protein YwgA